MQNEENGSNKFQIRRLGKFERSYGYIIKSHYRKDAKGRKEFEQQVECLIDKIEAASCLPMVSKPEPFPGNSAEPDFEFRKIRFRLPRLKGAAAVGRLLFIVCPSKRIVCLMWIYTHEEFQEPKGRPPVKELAPEVELAKQKILDEF